MNRQGKFKLLRLKTKGAFPFFFLAWQKFPESMAQDIAVYKTHSSRTDTEYQNGT